MSRASEDILDALHALVAQTLADGLKGKGENAPSPQMIAQAIKFLKDNGIDAPKSSKRFDNLAQALDDLDYEGIGAAN